MSLIFGGVVVRTGGGGGGGGGMPLRGWSLGACAILGVVERRRSQLSDQVVEVLADRTEVLPRGEAAG